MAAPQQQRWLFKSEPNVFSIDDLAAAPAQTTCWEGVRNYQARNLLRDDVAVGDLVLFHHSSAEPVGVAGVAKVVRAAYADPSQYEPASPYFDAKSPARDAGPPRWVAVDVRLVEKFTAIVPLATLRDDPALAKMMLLQRGSRLSIQPVTPAEFKRVLALAAR